MLIITERNYDQVSVFTNYRLSLVSVPFEPMCRLYIPIVKEHLEAGGKLEPRRGGQHQYTYINCRLL
jgi:hypothetical protein